MNAISQTESYCIGSKDCAMDQLLASAPTSLGKKPGDEGGVAKSASDCLIKSETKKGWGGARANTGGARPNTGSSEPRPGAGRKPKPKPVTRRVGVRWYVLELTPGSVDHTIRDLIEGETRKGHAPRDPFTIEVPMIAVPNGSAVDRVRMFGRYVFVQFDRDEGDWPALTACEGVLRLLPDARTRGSRPIPLPVGFVEKLIDETADRLKLPDQRLMAFEPGAALRITEGPFADHNVVCVSCDGLTTVVRATMFGREQTLPLRRSWVSAVVL